MAEKQENERRVTKREADPLHAASIQGSDSGSAQGEAASESGGKGNGETQKKMTKRPYTKRGRLSDVLALIQVLALDEHTHRSLSGVGKELQGGPSSSDSWMTVAKEHPEFFRVRPEGEHVLSLVARHVTQRMRLESEGFLLN